MHKRHFYLVLLTAKHFPHVGESSKWSDIIGKLLVRGRRTGYSQ